MRIPGTVLCVVALLWGFYQAPFAHFHPDDLDHPASASLVHWHLHHYEANNVTRTISAQTADDDAIDVGWNAVRCSLAQISCDFDVADIVRAPGMTVTVAPVQIPQRRGHDPPEQTSKSPRAPPL